jgi:hypothetical protein
MPAVLCARHTRLCVSDVGVQRGMLGYGWQLAS